MEKKQTVLVQRNGQVGPPEGFAPLEGEDLYRLKETALSLALAKANLETAQARVREHENGLEAARESVARESGNVSAIFGEKTSVELSLGIRKPDDLKVIGGLYFRRINGEAKPAASGHQPAGASGDRPTPE